MKNKWKLIYIWVIIHELMYATKMTEQLDTMSSIKLGFNPSLKPSTCLATLKSCDTMKLGLWMTHIYIYVYIHTYIHTHTRLYVYIIFEVWHKIHWKIRPKTDPTVIPSFACLYVHGDRNDPISQCPKVFNTINTPNIFLRWR